MRNIINHIIKETLNNGDSVRLGTEPPNGWIEAIVYWLLPDGEIFAIAANTFHQLEDEPRPFAQRVAIKYICPSMDILGIEQDVWDEIS